jgi:hypothetical protein
VVCRVVPQDGSRGFKVLVAPSKHVHGHDVSAIEAWMESVSTDTEREMSRAMRRVEVDAAGTDGSADFSSRMSASTALFHGLSDHVADAMFVRGKKLTLFHNELARQTAVHCPRVARCGRCDRVGA